MISQRVENKLEEKFVEFFEERFHSSDTLRAIKQKLQTAYIVSCSARLSDGTGTEAMARRTG